MLPYVLRPRAIFMTSVLLRPNFAAASAYVKPDWQSRLANLTRSTVPRLCQPDLMSNPYRQHRQVVLFLDRSCNMGITAVSH